MMYINTLVELHALIRDNKLVVVDFYTDNCVPCKIMDPILNKMATDKRFEQVQFAKMDAGVHEVPDLAIKAAPTFVFFKDGIEVSRKLGTIDEKSLATMIETVLMS